MKLSVPRTWRDVLTIARYDWDRLTIGALFIGFGVTDLLVPDITNPSSFFEIFRVSQFLLAGVLYMVGTVVKSYVMRGAATVLYATGLLAIAILVVLGSGSPTLWLIAAFALQGFADLRRLKLKNEVESTEDDLKVARRIREGGKP